MEKSIGFDMKQFWIAVIICAVVIAASVGIKKINFVQWTATNPSTFVYVQDKRTGICFAQTSNAMATVDCEKVQHLLD